MHVTKDMIDKDLRIRAALLKKTLPVFDERMFRVCDCLMRPMKGHKPRDMSYEQITVTGHDNYPLRLCIYRPLAYDNKLKPGILWFHGGGYGMGLPEQDESFYRLFTALGFTVLALDYRLSVHEPYPAALHDAYAGLCWMSQNASPLNIDADRLIVGGESAGGGLSAALAIYVRDKGGPQIYCQIPLYPMLDDRMNTWSARDNDAPVWNSVNNENGWKLYLRDLYRSDELSPYAAPGRLENFTNLPPAFTYVGTIDPFHDETVAYFAGLRKAGIPAACLAYDGCFHGFDILAPSSPKAKNARTMLKLFLLSL